ncbi:MAG TPA: histidine triad nucleotide-binding protein [Armatimonadota bacterium]|nr:histidine triad nucleotide-binding protein [Armatimonadota bacterium]
MSEDCIFCKIALGDIPSSRVYEDEVVVAFRDINPQAPIHIVLVPRKHVPSIDHLVAEDDGIVGHLVRTAAQIARDEGIAGGGYRLVANCGAAAGQSVDHLHFHLLGGRQLNWPPG